MNPLNYLKAIFAAVISGLGVAYIALDNDIITAQEWVQIAQTAIAAGGAVYGIPNISTGGKRAMV